MQAEQPVTVCPYGTGSKTCPLCERPEFITRVLVGVFGMDGITGIEVEAVTVNVDCLFAGAGQMHFYPPCSAVDQHPQTDSQH